MLECTWLRVAGVLCWEAEGGGDEVCDGLKGRRGEGGSECGTVCLKIKMEYSITTGSVRIN